MRSLFLILLLLFSNITYALTFDLFRLSNGIPVLVVEGRIREEDPLIFLRSMDEWNKRGIKIENIILNSNGGDVNAALAISQYILNKDINIYVLENHICASSCFMILAAGNQKFLSDKGNIGVHRISSNNSENKKTITLSVDMGAYYSSLNIPQDIINNMLRTAPEEVYWLSIEDKNLISRSKPNKSKSTKLLDNSGIKLPSITTNKKTIEVARNLNAQALNLPKTPDFYISSIKILELAKELAPADSEILANLGYFYYIYSKSEDFLKKAEDHILASIEVNSKRAISYKNLGEVYWYQMNKVKSREAFKKYLETSHDKSKAIEGIRRFGIQNSERDILTILKLE